MSGSIMDTQARLAYMTSAILFLYVAFLLGYGFPPDNKDMLNQGLGVVYTVWTLQMQNYFRSTPESKTKDETLNTMANTMSLQAAVGTGGASIVTAPTTTTTITTENKNEDTANTISSGA